MVGILGSVGCVGNGMGRDWSCVRFCDRRRLHGTLPNVRAGAPGRWSSRMTLLEQDWLSPRVGCLAGWACALDARLALVKLVGCVCSDGAGGTGVGMGLETKARN